MRKNVFTKKSLMTTASMLLMLLLASCSLSQVKASSGDDLPPIEIVPGDDPIIEVPPEINPDHEHDIEFEVLKNKSGSPSATRHDYFEEDHCVEELVRDKTALDALCEETYEANEHYVFYDLSSLTSQYDEEYFMDKALVVLFITEGSGSNHHEIASLSVKGSLLTVSLDRYYPGIGTCDMAYWTYIIEVVQSEIPLVEEIRTDINIISEFNHY